jgi:hypothetical protein
MNNGCKELLNQLKYNEERLNEIKRENSLIIDELFKRSSSIIEHNKNIMKEKDFIYNYHKYTNNLNSYLNDIKISNSNMVCTLESVVSIINDLSDIEVKYKNQEMVPNDKIIHTNKKCSNISKLNASSMTDNELLSRLQNNKVELTNIYDKNIKLKSKMVNDYDLNPDTNLSEDNENLTNLNKALLSYMNNENNSSKSCIKKIKKSDLINRIIEIAIATGICLWFGTLGFLLFILFLGEQAAPLSILFGAGIAIFTAIDGYKDF